MQPNSPLFSSESAEWTTPQYVFDWIDKHYGPVMLDAAATPSNHLAPFYFSRSCPDWEPLCVEDAMKRHWQTDGTVFLNPPYGREIAEWVSKAYYESVGHFLRVVMLLPARTDTRWWHEYVMRADEIWLLEGRLKFGRAAEAGEVKASAPFPSAIVVFDGVKYLAGEVKIAGLQLTRADDDA